MIIIRTGASFHARSPRLSVRRACGARAARAVDGLRRGFTFACEHLLRAERTGVGAVRVRERVRGARARVCEARAGVCGGRARVCGARYTRLCRVRGSEKV